MTPSLLAKAIGCSLDRATVWAAPLTKAMLNNGIDTVNEMASFLSQVAHESGNLTQFEENLNYSSSGLANTWPSRYRDPVTRQPNQLAMLLARHPEAIANNCYANRMGNGDVASGDGWKFRGRGPIMITGLDAYNRCGIAIGVDLLRNPQLLLIPSYGAASAGSYWRSHGLDKVDDDESQLAETKLINGGTIGLSEREALFKQTLKVLREG